jgi:putative ABC transport system substrate-binding protein
MKNQRLLLWLIFIFTSALLLLNGCKGGTNSGTPPTKTYRVGIVQVASHPLLDSVRSGFTERMKELGYNEGQNIAYDVQNAQGQPTTAQTIVQKFVSDKDDLIFTIGTSPSQAAAKATTTIPIVFGAITDPVSAGLVKDPSRPGGNITGTSDLSPFADQLKLLLQVAPQVKTIGMVYNPGEANSAFGVEETKKAAAQLGLQIKTAPITSTNEINSSALSLADQVDAFYSGTDNTVVSALESLIKVAEEKKKPLLAADPDSVQRGALITIGVDYKRLGIESANIADKIIKGAAPGSIPVVYGPGSVLAINKAAAQAQGVTIPDDLLKRATNVYDKKEQPKTP